MDKYLKSMLFKFLKIKSYTGKEKKAIEFIKKEMIKFSFDEINIDRVGNIIGCIKGIKKGPKILFDGHVDVVKADDIQNWKENPFKPYIKKGKLYARGSSDMKSAFISMLYAIGNLNKKHIQGSIYLSGTVNEEIAEGYAIDKVLDYVKPDAVVIGEASGLAINIGQRGRAEIILEIFGKASHSSNPNIGTNSILNMNKALSKIFKKYKKTKDTLGENILVCTDIISNPYPSQSVIPNYCKVTFDRRVILGETKNSILKQLDNILKNIKKNDSTFIYKLFLNKNKFKTYTGYHFEGDKFYNPWQINEKEYIVQIAKKAFLKSGINPNIGVYSFCTNGSTTYGKRKIPTIGFGPGNESKAHIANENIDIKDIETSIKIYKKIAINFGKELYK